MTFDSRLEMSLYATAGDIKVTSTIRLKSKDAKKLRANVAQQLYISDKDALDEMLPTKVRTWR